MDIFKYLIASLVGFVVGFIIRSRSAGNQIDELNASHKYTVDRLNTKAVMLRKWIKRFVLQRQDREEEIATEKRAEGIAALPPGVMVNIRDPYPFSMFYDFQNDDDPFRLPPGVFIEEGAFLTLGSKRKSYPYGNYTVFVLPGSDVYHTSSSCRNNYVLYPANIMSVLETRRPCTYCGRNMPHSKELPAWYRNFKKASTEMGIEW